MVRSVRLDPELEARVSRAAAAQGISVADFIRQAIRQHTDVALGRTLLEDLADVVGSIHGATGVGRGTDLAQRTGHAFTELLIDHKL
jgi:hypothetical protein